MSVSLLDSLLQLEDPDDLSAALRHSIIMNIRFLLESRQSLVPISEAYPGVAAAVYGYGLSSQYLGRSQYQANRLCQEIEKLLDRYEPRLKEVLVEMAQLNEQGNCISFHIEGVMCLQQQMVPVGFDSTLNLTDARLMIEESGIV